MKRRRSIVICGPYSGNGYTVLSELAKSLRDLKFLAYLCSELCPTKDLNDPAAIREATYECMKIAKAYLLVFLSPLSLGPKAREADLTGGTGFETGILYSGWKENDDIHVAFLFDGHQYRSHLSKLLQGNWMGQDLEAVVQVPGDMIEMTELAVQLCTSLENLI